MNNSDFTLSQIRDVLPILVKKSGATYSSDREYEYSSDNLIELDMNKFYIDHIIQEGTVVIIKFYCMAYYDELDNEIHYFKTLQEIETIKKYLNG